LSRHLEVILRGRVAGALSTASYQTQKPPGKSGGFLTNHNAQCGVVCRLGLPLRPLPGRPGEGGRGGWANQNNH